MKCVDRQACSPWMVAALVLGLPLAALAGPAARAMPGAKPAVALAGPGKSAPAVQTVGEGDQKLTLIDHDGTWSLHAESLNTDQLMRLWHQAGGPEMITKTIVDRPFTISVHRLPPERIVERLLEGYGFTLHYDAKGRLSLVRVYSPVVASMFKTPRLAETLGRWREVETPSAPGSVPATEVPPAPTGHPEPELAVPAPGDPAAIAPSAAAPTAPSAAAQPSSPEPANSEPAE